MIIEALTLAKTYLYFPENVDAQPYINNAEQPATTIFRSKYGKYKKNKLVPDSFNSVSVEEQGDCVLVELDSIVIKHLYFGYEIEVEAGNYAGFYNILKVDTVNNTILIKAKYFNESITFLNEERQIFESALGWYICAFSRFTLQQIKECKILVKSSQLGKGDNETYGVKSLLGFKKELLENGDDLMARIYFPRPI
jgi:hypothetical protein